MLFLCRYSCRLYAMKPVITLLDVNAFLSCMYSERYFFCFKREISPLPDIAENLCVLHWTTNGAKKRMKSRHTVAEHVHLSVCCATKPEPKHTKKDKGPKHCCDYLRSVRLSDLARCVVIRDLLCARSLPHSCQCFQQAAEYDLAAVYAICCCHFFLFIRRLCCLAAFVIVRSLTLL